MSGRNSSDKIRPWESIKGIFQYTETTLQKPFWSNYCFYNRSTIQLDGMHPRLLVLVEIKADQIAFIDMVIVQIIGELLLPLRIVLVPTPNFQLNDILFAQVVYDHIGAATITGLRFNVVVTHTIDNGTEIEKEKLSSILFLKFIGFRAVDVR